MKNLLILGMNTNLLQELKKVVSNKKSTQTIDRLYNFLEKNLNEISAIEIDEAKNVHSPQTDDDVEKIITTYCLDNKKSIIIKELESIGYNPKYRGTKYLVDTILEIYKNTDVRLDSLQSDFYPIVAKKYNKSVQNIKNCIKTATNSMYLECDIEKLKSYFNLYEDKKPTVRQVVFTIINHISK